MRNKERLLLFNNLYCNKCKEIKSINNFAKNKTTASGFHGQCKICSKKASKDYWIKQRNSLSSVYLKHILKSTITNNTLLKRNQIIINEELLKIQKLSILNRRISKYNLDNQYFNSERSLAKYVELNYGIKSNTYRNRLQKLKLTPLEALNYERIYKTNKKILI